MGDRVMMVIGMMNLTTVCSLESSRCPVCLISMGIERERRASKYSHILIFLIANLLCIHTKRVTLQEEVYGWCATSV